MCYAEVRQYTECKHEYGYNILQPCLLGLTPTGGCASNSLQLVYVVPHSQPRLCPPCYREVETKIFDFHDSIIADMRAGRDVKPHVIGEVTGQGMLVRNGAHWQRRGRMIAALGLIDVACGEKAWTEEDERLVRNGVIASFREDMGVWGDG